MITLLICALLSVSLANHPIFNPDLDDSKTIITVENATKISVVTEEARVVSKRGQNATLSCLIERDPSLEPNPKMRIKWTKLTSDYLTELDVFVALDYQMKGFGSFQGRVQLKGSSCMDASLLITDISLEDYGKYKCEVIDGLDEATVVVSLSLEGVVFPYFPKFGRYNLTFRDAEEACRDQDATVASSDQLFEAWQQNLDWCNAGWLSDGTVKYPITRPRAGCGGPDAEPGIRSYGLRDKERNLYDVFCFTSVFSGRFYFLTQPSKFTFDEAVSECLRDGSVIAKVGHMYAAWKLLNYNRCDAGWLADGSVRYPISRPSPRCSPTGAAIRFKGFPDKKQKLYGVYCYEGPN